MGCESHKAFIFRPLTNNNLYAHIICWCWFSPVLSWNCSRSNVPIYSSWRGRNFVSLRNLCCI